MPEKKWVNRVCVKPDTELYIMELLTTTSCWSEVR